MKTIISITLLISLLALLFLHFFLTNIAQTLNIFLQIFGGFIATLFGVYISINLVNKEERRKKLEINENNLIESLKLILNEISFNKLLLMQSLKILEKKPDKVFLIKDDFEDSLFILGKLESRAYYALISSERFTSISSNSNLFGAISSVYDNMQLTIAIIIMSNNSLASYTYSKASKETEHDRLYANSILDKAIKQIKGQIKIDSKAEKEIKKILANYKIYYKTWFTQL